jgi:protein-tyrosine-phosphatase
MAERGERTVLFLCTGNYYRSRFAEILFNSVR